MNTNLQFRRRGSVEHNSCQRILKSLPRCRLVNKIGPTISGAPSNSEARNVNTSAHIEVTLYVVSMCIGVGGMCEPAELERLTGN